MTLIFPPKIKLQYFQKKRNFNMSAKHENLVFLNLKIDNLKDIFLNIYLQSLKMKL